MRAGDLVIVGIVMTIASIFAASMLASYAADPGQLWHDLNHDRNGHFSAGLNLALAEKSFSVVEVLRDLMHARVWPPLHDIAVAFVLLFGKIDVRLAILPSLVGWVCTMVLTFLTARHLFADRFSGHVAGTIAVTFALASPAFRLITADVMLEGLGAALTAFCLYAYLRASEGIDRNVWWSVLALALTALFFEKYNYWLLTAVPIGIAYLSEDLRDWRSWGRVHLTKSDLRNITDAALRDPLIITTLLLIILDVAVYVLGPAAIDLFGHHVSLYPPENLVTITWGVLFIRATLLWREYRKSFEAIIGFSGRRLFYWHLFPIALSFLIPKRLSAFLWFVGPSNAHGEAYNPLRAFAFQWLAFSSGFHVAPWAAALVIGLAAVAAIRLCRRAPGGRAVLILALLSATLVVLHPQQQWRFQTTWLFSVWILAGTGGALVLRLITARLPRLVRIVVAAASIVALALGENRESWTDVAYAAAIHPRSGPSDLDLAKTYLPYVTGVQHVGFLTTFPKTSFFSWTVREACRCLADVDMPWQAPLRTREQYRHDAETWLLQTRAERIIAIDMPLYSIPELGLTQQRLFGQIEAIERDGRFQRIATQPVPSLGATVTIWRRVDKD